ncbi:DUF4405 domain-containing protein [Synoicihabitans lomoniglobus]|uniref:DUF4405 domain-containing protein n=1 Tax=Synoicihabitans lomoniglobus TaxID=2909285 RepID=A0AAE9ZX96_9BACT|nr:DUF4405 domain-containing protein [Opitutaceae bacterium LMO-M01]WED64914.1 DUF4405 domain-containing protein [Opitutaceae bacterium LMO-M01]
MKASTRTLLNRVLNLLLLLNGAFILGTGWLMDQRLPRGRDGHGLTVLGLGRHDWGELHAWAGYGIGVLVVGHLLLHLKWLHLIAAQRNRWKLAVGLGTAVLLMALFVLIPVRG